MTFLKIYFDPRDILMVCVKYIIISAICCIKYNKKPNRWLSKNQAPLSAESGTAPIAS